MTRGRLMIGAICAFAAGGVLMGSAGEQAARSGPAPTGSGRVVELFNGRDLAGWKVVPFFRTTADPNQWKAVGAAAMSPANERLLRLEPGRGVLSNGEGKTSSLVSEFEHGDALLHIEFMIPRGGNSGVYLQGLYEVQIIDSHGSGRTERRSGDVGGLYGRWRNEQTYEGHAPLVDASKAAGEWQSFDIVFRAPRFDATGKKTQNARFVFVAHNGQVIHQDAEVTGGTREAMERPESPKGPLMLQGDHGPVAYRNIKVIPLSLN